MTPEQAARRRMKYREAEQFITLVVECYVLAEAAWYIKHDGEQWLHEAVLEQLARFRDAVTYRVQVLETLRHIRRLPER